MSVIPRSQLLSGTSIHLDMYVALLTIVLVGLHEHHSMHMVVYFSHSLSYLLCGVVWYGVDGIVVAGCVMCSTCSLY